MQEGLLQDLQDTRSLARAQLEHCADERAHFRRKHSRNGVEATLEDLTHQARDAARFKRVMQRTELVEDASGGPLQTEHEKKEGKCYQRFAIKICCTITTQPFPVLTTSDLWL
jgi:hypothetical protein